MKFSVNQFANALLNKKINNEEKKKLFFSKEDCKLLQNTVNFYSELPDKKPVKEEDISELKSLNYHGFDLSFLGPQFNFNHNNKNNNNKNNNNNNNINNNNLNNNNTNNNNINNNNNNINNKENNNENKIKKQSQKTSLDVQSTLIENSEILLDLIQKQMSRSVTNPSLEEKLLFVKLTKKLSNLGTFTFPDQLVHKVCFFFIINIINFYLYYYRYFSIIIIIIIIIII